MKKSLCTPCAALMRESYQLQKVGGGVDNKITCELCGKRRYGADYEIEKKKGKKK